MTNAEERALLEGLRKAGLLRPYVRIEIQVGENMITNLKITETVERAGVKFDTDGTKRKPTVF